MNPATATIVLVVILIAVIGYDALYWRRHHRLCFNPETGTYNHRWVMKGLRQVCSRCGWSPSGY